MPKKKKRKSKRRGSSHFNAARKAAIAAGWKPFTKMSAKQKAAFRNAMKGD
jgi:hypothetical protein